MNTQTLVLDAIEAAVEENGAKLVRDGEWANTGTVYAVRGLSPLGPTLRYDFQSTYFRFRSPADGHGPSLAAYGNGGRHSIEDAVGVVVNALLGDEEVGR